MRVSIGEHHPSSRPQESCCRQQAHASMGCAQASMAALMPFFSVRGIGARCKLKGFDTTCSARGTTVKFTAPMFFCFVFCNLKSTAPMLAYRSLVAAARGDGLVAVFDVDNTPPKRNSAAAASSSGVSKAATGCSVTLTAADGGHSKPACAVIFAPSSAGRLVLSGGQDRKLLLWDWTAKLAGSPAEEDKPSCVTWQQQHKYKVNCIECRDAGGRLEVLVGDVSKQIASYVISC
jgi:hypothetical protein